jgi:hypothetical protein
VGRWESSAGGDAGGPTRDELRIKVCAFEVSVSVRTLPRRVHSPTHHTLLQTTSLHSTQCHAHPRRTPCRVSHTHCTPRLGSRQAWVGVCWEAWRACVGACACVFLGCLPFSFFFLEVPGRDHHMRPNEERQTHGMDTCSTACCLVCATCVRRVSLSLSGCVCVCVCVWSWYEFMWS